MLPLAVCFGEVFTLESTGVVGFLDRADLHTPTYLSMNLGAGKRGDCWFKGGRAVDCFFFFLTFP